MMGEGKSESALSLADKIARDLLGGVSLPKGKTAFGKLISAQNEQILVIRDAYEEELKDLSMQVDALQDKIGTLEAEKEVLEEKLKSKKQTKKEGEAKNDKESASHE